jgi:hypothetical protein
MLPARIQEKMWFKAILGIIYFILIGYFAYTALSSYFSYSYAKVSQDGRVIEKKNFDYQIKRSDIDGKAAYFILGKKDTHGLDVTTSNAASYKLVEENGCVKIQFVATGFGNPTIPSDFEITIRK